MDIDQTIEFLLENQSRMDARWGAYFEAAERRFEAAERRFAAAERRSEAAERRLDRLERVVAQNNRIVSQLAKYGVSLRSDVRRIERNLATITERLSETDDKLNGLIDIVRRHLQGNGRRK